jgi:hypothetical protein
VEENNMLLKRLLQFNCGGNLPGPSSWSSGKLLELSQVAIVFYRLWCHGELVLWCHDELVLCDGEQLMNLWWRNCV